MKNPVAWFEIYVDDMERAQVFYETVLDVQLNTISVPGESSVEMKAFPSDMDDYGASGALVRMEGFPVGNNSVLVYFACEECSIEEARIELAGGHIQKSKFSIGDYGYITLGLDTEGNMFGLHSMN